MNDKTVDQITQIVASDFRCFGGGKYTPNNPLSIAMADKPPMFAGGVDVREVVRTVLKNAERIQRGKRRKARAAK